MFEDIFTDSQLLVSSLAMLISFISILLAFFSLKIQRAHNIRSVKPIGNIVLSDYLDHLSIDIENNGVGPLLILNVFIEKEGGSNGDSIIDLMPENPAGLHWTNFSGGLSGFVITPGSEINLLKLNGDVDDNVFTDFRDLVRSELKRMTITFTYMDIYGKKMPQTQRVLDWFGRHEKGEVEKEKSA